jgi:hypothetical protein
MKLLIVGAALVAVLTGISSTAVAQNGLCTVGMGTNAHWISAVEAVRQGSLKHGSREFDELMQTAARLTPAERSTLSVQLARHYHSTLSKDKSRRSVELALNVVFRPDLAFKSRRGEGQSAVDAYRATTRDFTRLTGAEVSFSADDILSVARAIQPIMAQDQVVYLEGSSASGKALVAKRSEVAGARSQRMVSHSDIDLVFETKHWWDQGLGKWIDEKLPYAIRRQYLRAHEIELRATVQDVLESRYPGVLIPVQAHDVTPDFGSIHQPGAWKYQGVMNPFIVEVRKTEMFLNVFEPAKFVPPMNPRSDGSYEPGAFERHRLP